MRQQRLTLKRRLRRPANRLSCYARVVYGEEVHDAERYRLGSLAWLRLEALAAVGWPLNAVRFWREVYALNTAHPGDVWVCSEYDFVGVVWKVDARGTWLLAAPIEYVEEGGRFYEPRLIPRYRYLAWSPTRRGVLT